MLELFYTKDYYIEAKPKLLILDKLFMQEFSIKKPSEAKNRYDSWLNNNTSSPKDITIYSKMVFGFEVHENMLQELPSPISSLR